MTEPAAASYITDENGESKRVYVVEGIANPSAGEVLNVLDKPGLNIWKLKGVALGIASDVSLQQDALEGREYKAAMRALEAMSNDPADRGTAVHKVVELHLKGEEDAILSYIDELEQELIHRKKQPKTPEEAREFIADVLVHVDQFLVAAREHALRPVYVEQSVVSLGMNYAGTADNISHLVDPNHLCDLAHVTDVKTGSLYPEVGLQMAAYANATHLVRFDPMSGENVISGPLEGVCLQLGYAFSCHADECKVIPVELGPCFAAFIAARELHRWEERKKSVFRDRLRPTASLLPW